MAHTELTPLPGDPSALKAKADGLASAAEQIQAAINHLRKLSDHDATVSLAIDKVRGDARDVADNITKAQVRYAGTARALQDYAPKLESAQQRALRAISAHNSAVQQASTAQSHLQNQSDQYRHDQATAAAQHPSDTNEPPEKFGNTPAGRLANQAVDDANQAVTDAIKEYNEAKAEVDAAANTAISQIKKAIHDSGLNDGFWDKLGHAISSAWHDAVAWAKKYLAPVLDVIQKIAEQLTNVLGWISLALNIAAVFLPFLAPIAAAVDLITLGLAALSFLTTLALVGLGDRTWGDVLSTGITLVLSAAGVKGAGKALTKTADDITNQGMKHFAQSLGGKMEAFGSHAGMKTLSKVDEKIADKLDKIGDFVGDKAGALGKYLNKSKIEGQAMDAGADAYSESIQQGASSLSAAIHGHAVAAGVSHQLTEDVVKTWKNNANGLTNVAVDVARDGVQTTVVSNGSHSLDSYVFHQQDHNPSGFEWEVPESAPHVDFVSAEHGIAAPTIASAFTADWSKAIPHFEGVETAELAGAH
ncbi:hypothetical protein [Humibacter ginsenosidimutans]|uniref:Uncharacterized protein n=1 Tax=Humibacter ginsenosidimutans TaxID=2599293 RepID=A0A5B8M3T7_9MICO|nr:hypothetical protein [Humibacter ginsenosidimutans]QDZ15023.1 hypothetical protein FPZ11_09805 [Humibacter ginsenosidimutans]